MGAAASAGVTAASTAPAGAGGAVFSSARSRLQPARVAAAARATRAKRRGAVMAISGLQRQGYPAQGDGRQQDQSRLAVRLEQFQRQGAVFGFQRADLPGQIRGAGQQAE